MEEVTLPKLLRDWLDKTKFPIVSITGVNQTYGKTDALGHIWIGDFDVAVIYSNKIALAGVANMTNINNGKFVYSLNTPPNGWLYAEDPEFFTKLEATLTHLLGLLKDNG